MAWQQPLPVSCRGNSGWEQGRMRFRCGVRHLWSASTVLMQQHHGCCTPEKIAKKASKEYGAKGSEPSSIPFHRLGHQVVFVGIGDSHPDELTGFEVLTL